MSSTSQAALLRSLAAIGILSAAGLAAPAASLAQAGAADRALLNRVAISAPTPHRHSSGPAGFASLDAGAVSGERALLARTTPGSHLAPAGLSRPAATAPPVDGSRALLGRWSTADLAAVTPRSTAAAE